MLWKCCTQYASKFGKLNSGHRTGKGQFSFQSKERQWQRMLRLLHNCTHLTWQPTPVLLPGNSHGRRSLVGCSPSGCWGLDMTEWLHFHFSLSCIGEGNGNPLQCSYLENPRDGGAWWAAISGVAQSRTWLQRLSSSSSSSMFSSAIFNLFYLLNFTFSYLEVLFGYFQICQFFLYSSLGFFL